ncbi:glucoamylase family protein [Sphingobacterium lumbrici]|uniref:glucoamylase family protein n=1 Tax=Sphingobacterium lumbrici TaxID=2559600 RepID=UPI00112B249E|nr:glucoamylase family protein [Sphingobacterium lumbrici]
MKIFKLLFSFIVFVPTFLVANTYPEVIFDNSLVKGVYAKSTINYSGKSWVENVNHHLLVSDTLFFTPGNALSLKYISAEEGNWKAEIKYSRQKYHYKFDNDDFLSIRIFVKSTETGVEDLPKLYVKQPNSTSMSFSLEKFIIDYEVNKWVQVKIPISAIRDINFNEPIGAIGFQQHKSSNRLQHIFIDQIEFLAKNYPQVKLSSPAILTDAVPYDRQVHLKWQLPLTPSIHYIKIYRSEDGENFKPIGIRPVQMQSCLDMVPILGRKYYYKIAWVDYNYQESPFSAVKEIMAKELKESQLLDLIQLAHVNYFVENYDVNSGMYMPFRMKDKAVVSTKETGGAIISLLIGAERKFISRQAVYGRISKIVYFLLKAQNNKGIFPSYFNGRGGVPEYRNDSPQYDVSATSNILEALLIAREYFSGDSVEEVDLRKRITKLYEGINWQELTLEGTNDILRSSLPAAGDLNTPLQLTLHGINESINTYFLAMAAPKFPLPLTSYYNAVYHNYSSYKPDPIEEGEVDIHADSLASDTLLLSENQKLVTLIDTFIQTSILKDTLLYGSPLKLGEYNRSLMELYKTFLTVSPDLVQDTVLDFKEVLNSYVHFVKRRDNEMGVGSTDSDIWGFYQHRDSIGNYRINPSIAPSSIFVDKEVGLQAVLALYHQYGNVLFTEYGFRSWLDLRNDDVSDEYLATNQSTLSIALENYRSGLIWKLYAQIPELKAVRESLFAINLEPVNE